MHVESMTKKIVIFLIISIVIFGMAGCSASGHTSTSSAQEGLLQEADGWLDHVVQFWENNMSEE